MVLCGELNEINFARFDAKSEQRLAEVKAELRQEIAGLRADLIKWMFVFWVGNFATTAGLMFGLAHFLRS